MKAQKFTLYTLILVFYFFVLRFQHLPQRPRAISRGIYPYRYGNRAGSAEKMLMPGVRQLVQQK